MSIVLSPNDAFHVPLIFCLGNEVHPLAMVMTTAKRITYADFILLVSLPTLPLRRAAKRRHRRLVGSSLSVSVGKVLLRHYSSILHFDDDDLGIVSPLVWVELEPQGFIIKYIAHGARKTPVARKPTR
jgi:hypothetical protein